MSSVLDYRHCPQCKFEQADFEFNCRTSEEYLQCRMCGYCEYVDRETDSEGKVSFKHRVIRGAGALLYRRKGAIGYCARYLATQEEVSEAAQWLSEKLAAGEVRPSSAYLSRWNKETPSVELVIGRLYEFSNYDPDDENPEPNGPNDLRPFQLIEMIRHLRVRYSCDHILDGRIVLLHEQPEPKFEQVFETALPCLSCLPKSLDEIGRLGQYQEFRQSRTELWEYRFPQAKDGRVMPAFNHPKTLQEAASLFYLAHPDRKRFFPDSESAFRHQLHGLPDKENVVTFFYAEPDGTRGIIAVSDFVLELFNGVDGFGAKLRKQGFTEVLLLDPKEIDAAKEKVSYAPGDWGGSWKNVYPWQRTSWQAKS